ncbi:MAG: hypothetical protein ABT19_09660 [Rhodanobacter sp. SCN 68-63]|nr:MAG: hypothetical protein ABT19_09660 [Rhodanobacter sp. SCN 68-63]
MLSVIVFICEITQCLQTLLKFTCMRRNMKHAPYLILNDYILRGQSESARTIRIFKRARCELSMDLENG